MIRSRGPLSFTIVLGCLVVLGTSCATPPAAPDGAPMTSGDGGVADGGPDDGGPGDASAGDLDAGPACVSGEMRASECGNCGLRSEVCTGGAWETVSECLGEGPCAAGAIEVEAGAFCAERTRICDEGCAWRPWVSTRESGICEPGETRALTDGCAASEMRTELCSTECVWVEDVGCSDACVGTRRTAPWDAEEICVPQGSFRRGRAGWAEAIPERDVYVSNFYVDRYPVTNRRYQLCLSAGICPAPSVNGALDLADSARADHPVHGITWHGAVAFCDWDGGRRLPTEAEWEKAARGPLPSDLDYPWGSLQCSHIDFRSCGWTPPAGERFRTPDPVNAYSTAASMFGVDVLVGSVWQWVGDWYSTTYYGDPSSLVDPQGPATGTTRVYRGCPRDGTAPQLWRRLAVEPTWGPSLVGIRCARNGD